MGRFTKTIDSISILLITAISFFGIFLLLTISKALFFSQLEFFLVGIVVVFLLSSVDGMVYRWFAPIGYVILCVFLASSYLGPSVRGATRWFEIAGIRLQPSELAKPIFLLSVSYFLTRFPPRTLKHILLHFGLFSVPFLLVFKQPDLGSSLVYTSMWAAMIVAAGLRIRYAFGAVGFFGILSPLIYQLLAPYQKSRIATFLNPALDPQGAGYNAIQAMIAVGSGQWFGRGLGFGTQSHLEFLPEAHTDFIFASLVEELGLVGGLALFTAYIILLWRIVSPLIRQEESDALTYIYSVGLFAMILVQIFINTGMNMGIIPVTGITLPLVSYGGSSILSVCASFGILWAIRTKFGRMPTIAIR